MPASTVVVGSHVPLQDGDIDGLEREGERQRLLQVVWFRITVSFREAMIMPDRIPLVGWKAFGHRGERDPREDLFAQDVPFKEICDIDKRAGSGRGDIDP